MPHDAGILQCFIKSCSIGNRCQSLSVAVNQQVHTAMSVLLRLLPLLVVGCLLLQSLQPTAGQDVSEPQEAIALEDYATKFDMVLCSEDVSAAYLFELFNCMLYLAGRESSRCPAR